MTITNEQIYTELHKLKDAQEKHKESVDRWRVKSEARQDKFDHTLYGNGDAGLDEIVRQHDAKLASLTKLSETLQPMIVFYRVGVWMSTLLGASILALIWALITGSAELTFK